MKNLVNSLLNSIHRRYSLNDDDIPDDDIENNLRMNSFLCPKTREELDKMIISNFIEYGPNANLNDINVYKITNFDNLFNINGSLTNYSWDTDSNTYFERNGIYLKSKEDISKFLMSINPDVSKWNVSNATTMRGMFGGCLSFNRDLSLWDVSHVDTFDDTFALCASFKGIGLSKWADKVDKIVHDDLWYTGWELFKGCIAFKEDLSSWTIKITDVPNHLRVHSIDRLKSFFGFKKIDEDDIRYITGDVINDSKHWHQICKLFNTYNRFPEKFLPKIVYI